MNCPPTNNALFFSSVSDISTDIWQQLNCMDNLYFHPDYLISLEKNNPKINFNYIVLIDNQHIPVAFAIIKIINFQIHSIENEIKKLKCIVRKLFFLKQQHLKMLVCGNTFVSGEHGIFIKKNQNKKEVIKKLSKAISHFVNTNKKLKKELNIFLIKDFNECSVSTINQLHNYHSFNVSPNMVLELDIKWKNFNDYLAAMKTKFRVKAKKALKQSDPLRIENVSLKNIKNQLPKMTLLYEKVVSKSDFNLGNFNLKTYQSLKEKLGDNYILKTYWLEDKMVGFLSGMIHKNSLDTHFVGIDYELNRKYAIYQRMLYDYVKIAIYLNLKIVNFGRTASEIKSSIGATPKHLTVYIRHKKLVPNRLLKAFFKRIESAPFEQKFPFKSIENNS